MRRPANRMVCLLAQGLRHLTQCQESSLRAFTLA
jgi:hypothetical protein